MSELTKATALQHAVVFDADAVTGAWKASQLSHLQLVSTNKKYRALPQADWDAILAQHGTLHPYTPDFFDCDAYSAVFVGFVLWHFEINGVVRVFDDSGRHSYNAVLVVSDDAKTCQWKRVEPQTDTFVGAPPNGVRVTAPAGAYAAKSGFAITA